MTEQPTRTTYDSIKQQLVSGDGPVKVFAEHPDDGEVVEVQLEMRSLTPPSDQGPGGARVVHHTDREVHSWFVPKEMLTDDTQAGMRERALGEKALGAAIDPVVVGAAQHDMDSTAPQSSETAVLVEARLKEIKEQLTDEEKLAFHRYAVAESAAEQDFALRNHMHKKPLADEYRRLFRQLQELHY